jgi:hypothetical protein
MKKTEILTNTLLEIAGEEWRPLPRSTYPVSNKGRVMNRFGKVLKAQVMQVSKYMQYSAYGIRLEGETKMQMRYGHHLVAQLFMGDRPLKFEINHINLDSRDNRAENLEYISSRDNQMHSSYMKGRRSTNLVIAYDRGMFMTKIRRPEYPEISVGSFQTPQLAKGAINIWCSMNDIPVKEHYYFSHDEVPRMRPGRKSKVV